MFLLYQSVPRVLLFRLASGMAVGLGTVIGATFLLSILAWSLSQVEFIPIIGEWAAEIARSMSELGSRTVNRFCQSALRAGTRRLSARYSQRVTGMEISR
jgi:hypothetical protein